MTRQTFNEREREGEVGNSKREMTRQIFNERKREEKEIPREK